MGPHFNAESWPWMPLLTLIKGSFGEKCICDIWLTSTNRLLICKLNVIHTKNVFYSTQGMHLVHTSKSWKNWLTLNSGDRLGTFTPLRGGDGNKWTRQTNATSLFLSTNKVITKILQLTLYYYFLLNVKTGNTLYNLHNFEIIKTLKKTCDNRYKMLIEIVTNNTQFTNMHTIVL